MLALGAATPFMRGARLLVLAGDTAIQKVPNPVVKSMLTIFAKMIIAAGSSVPLPFVDVLFGEQLAIKLDTPMVPTASYQEADYTAWDETAVKALIKLVPGRLLNDALQATPTQLPLHGILAKLKSMFSKPAPAATPTVANAAPATTPTVADAGNGSAEPAAGEEACTNYPSFKQGDNVIVAVKKFKEKYHVKEATIEQLLSNKAKVWIPVNSEFKTFPFANLSLKTQGAAGMAPAAGTGPTAGIGAGTTSTASDASSSTGATAAPSSSPTAEPANKKQKVEQKVDLAELFGQGDETE
jgi:hypothetical protein